VSRDGAWRIARWMPSRREQGDGDKECAYPDSSDTREVFAPMALVHSVHAITVSHPVPAYRVVPVEADDPFASATKKEVDDEDF
jgi:hypothetical protein